MSTLFAVADALTAAVNAAPLAVDLTAKRRFSVDSEIKDLSAYVASVVPRGSELAVANRGNFRDVHRVLIVLQKRVGFLDGEPVSADVEAAADVVEALFGFARGLATLELAGGATARLRTEEVEVAYEGQHLETHHTFTGIVTVPYEVYTA